MLAGEPSLSFESKGRPIDISRTFDAPMALIGALRGLFWVSGVGGVLVAGIAALVLAFGTERPVKNAQPPEPSLNIHLRHTSGPTSLVADNPAVEWQEFDMSLLLDPAYLAAIEEQFNATP